MTKRRFQPGIRREKDYGRVEVERRLEQCLMYADKLVMIAPVALMASSIRRQQTSGLHHASNKSRTQYKKRRLKAREFKVKLWEDDKCAAKNGSSAAAALPVAEVVERGVQW